MVSVIIGCKTNPCWARNYIKDNMNINITQDPPGDFTQIKNKYLRIIPYLLLLIVCALT